MLVTCYFIRWLHNLLNVLVQIVNKMGLRGGGGGPLELRPDKGCAADAQQNLKTTDPTSHQRGRPT
jgi:hypothetical protein